jgi:hypothetical protein
MGYGWAKSNGGLITYQDAAEIHGKTGFRLIDTLLSAGALSAQDPAILTDPRYILVPPNFMTGLQTAQPPTEATLANVQDASGACRTTQGHTCVSEALQGRSGALRHFHARTLNEGSTKKHCFRPIRPAGPASRHWRCECREAVI